MCSSVLLLLFLIGSAVTTDSAQRWWRFWSDCMDGQADQGFYCQHAMMIKYWDISRPMIIWFKQYFILIPTDEQHKYIGTGYLKIWMEAYGL